jgi:hypothetical protein
LIIESRSTTGVTRNFRSAQLKDGLLLRLLMRLFNLLLSCHHLSSRCRLPSHPCCSSHLNHRHLLFVVISFLWSSSSLPHLPLRPHPRLRPSSPSLRASESNTHIHRCRRIISSPSPLQQLPDSSSGSSLSSSSLSSSPLILSFCLLCSYLNRHLRSPRAPIQWRSGYWL